MKKEFGSVSQNSKFEKFLSNFSDSDILSSYSMNCIRGGEGGESDPVPPPPPPKP